MFALACSLAHFQNFITSVFLPIASLLEHAMLSTLEFSLSAVACLGGLVTSSATFLFCGYQLLSC